MFTDYKEEGVPLLSDASRRLAASFRLRNSNMTIANTLRRATLSMTPSVGFRTEPYEKSDVHMSINTTPLVNDMLLHRFGQIPVCADPTTFDPSLYEFRLDKTNDTKEMMNVEAKDIQVFVRDPERPLEPAQHKPELTDRFFPPDPISGDTILLTRLRPQWNATAPKEQVKLVAKATVSTGEENARWSPVSQVSFENTRDPDPAHRQAVLEHWLLTQKKIRTDASLSEEERKTVAEKKLLIWDTMEEGKRAALEREFETMEIQRCFLKDAKGDPVDFTYHVESVGVQPVGMIVNSGLEACERLVTKYINLDKALPLNVRIQQGDSRFPTMDVIFQDEGHTLGNLLETHLCQNNIEAEVSALPLTYVAYKVPHPLRREMFVRLGVANEEVTDVAAQTQAARLVIAAACQELRDQFRRLRAQWGEMVSPGVTESKGPE